MYCQNLSRILGYPELNDIPKYLLQTPTVNWRLLVGYESAVCPFRDNLVPVSGILLS